MSDEVWFVCEASSWMFLLLSSCQQERHGSATAKQLTAHILIILPKETWNKQNVQNGFHFFFNMTRREPGPRVIFRQTSVRPQILPPMGSKNNGLTFQTQKLSDAISNDFTFTEAKCRTLELVSCSGFKTIAKTRATLKMDFLYAFWRTMWKIWWTLSVSA